MRPELPALLLALCALVPGAVWALATDREQPIHIEADRVEIDDIEGISVYRGSVVYTQGTIRLEADTVHVRHTPERTITRIEAVGEPARFRQRIDGQDEDLQGHARRIEYHANPERVVLQGEAWIRRLDAEFSGEAISYEADRDVVQATRGDGDEGRVRIVIQPRGGDGGGSP